MRSVSVPGAALCTQTHFCRLPIAPAEAGASFLLPSPVLRPHLERTEPGASPFCWIVCLFPQQEQD